VDAIPASRLRRLLRSCIERHIDRHALEKTQAIEAQEREMFESTFGRLFSNAGPAASAPELSALPDRWPDDLPTGSILLPSPDGMDEVRFVVEFLNLCSINHDDIVAAKLASITPRLAA
jgi:hypothetical protein